MIYIFRHGRTTWNELGILQGAGEKEGELLESSYHDMDRIQSFLQDKNIVFDQFFLSPLKRVIKSFEYLHPELLTPSIQTDFLKEIDFGIYNGSYLNEIDEKILQEREKNKFLFCWEQGESYEMVDKRIKKLINQFQLKNHLKKNIGIMAHQTVNKLIIHNFLPEIDYFSIKQLNNEVIVIGDNNSLSRFII